MKKYRTAMNRRDQVKFVRELSKNIADEIIKNIKNGKIPDTWDGWELRQLLSDKAGTMIMPKSRKAEYDNTVIVNDL